MRRRWWTRLIDWLCAYEWDSQARLYEQVEDGTLRARVDATRKAVDRG